MKKNIVIKLLSVATCLTSFVAMNSASAMMIKRHLDEASTCDVFNLGVSEDGAVSEINPDFRPNVMVVNFDGFNHSLNQVENKKLNQFDGNIEKPEEAPQRIGYKFRGWKVTGRKSCADFNNTDSCTQFESCVWKNNACVQNPCVKCSTILTENDEEKVTCSYGIYDAETDTCSLENESQIRDTDMATEMVK